jgi:hypothetical protein
MYTCRECEQPINQASELCPYCGADLTIPPPDETGAPPKKRSLARVLFLWVVVIAGLWAIAWLALPSRLFNPSTHDSEQRAREAMADLQTALSSYAAAEGNFPATLEALGEQARRAAQWAQTGGYRLLYTPAEPGPDGRVHNYTLLARPGNYSYRNFYSDATGVVRATREDRPATPQDPPI